MNAVTKNFLEFKSEWTFQHEHEDYFLDKSNIGCHEASFENWLKNKRLFIMRYTVNSLDWKLASLSLPEKKWFFFTELYEREMMSQFLTDKYPDGFFEAVSPDGSEVAAFLPDTYSKKPYRISYYKAHGAIYHETYSTRQEALKHLAHSRFTAEEGALDALVGTDEWNRGIYICNWISEGILPNDGLLRDKHIPEVSYLFSDRLRVVHSESYLVAES